MSELRIILLLLGIGVIIAVYAWTRFQQHQPRRRPVLRRAVPGPARGDEPDADEIEQELSRMERLLAEDGEPDVAESGAEKYGVETFGVETFGAEKSGAEKSGVEKSGQKSGAVTSSPDQAPVDEARPSSQSVDGPGLVIVSVMAETGNAFAGEALSKAFQHNRLRPGEQSIYHRMVFRNSREHSVFSVANVVKPGTFPSDMEQFSTPGLTLFLQLPAPIDDLEAFDDFVTTAERLAVELGGELRDERRQLLSHQQLMQVRDSIAGGRPSTVSRPA